MSKIPDDILETLICTECACYLSFGPIRLKIEGGPVCGRCLLPDNSHVTDTPYENLAKMMNFPCRYKKYGCKHEEKFGEVKTHEDDCEYKEYFCPVITDGSCKWIGSVKQILEHVENNHNDKLLKHPCEVPHIFTKNQTNIFITSVYDFLFLIHLEFFVSTRKIRHWVRILASKEYAQHFEFNLSIESPCKKQHMVKTKGVLPFETDSEDALVTSATVLQEFFDKMEDIKFVLSINTLSNHKCCACQRFIKEIVYQSGNQYKCEKCLPALKTCKSCGYQDIETKLVKHEAYFCRKVSRCVNCTPGRLGDFYTNDTLQEHVKKEHPNAYHNSNEFKTLNNVCTQLSIFPINKENQQLHVIKTEIGQIFFELYKTINQTCVTIHIYSPLTNNDFNNYDCYLEIHHPENNYKFEAFLQRENGLNPDWILKIENLKDSDFKTEMDIKVTFPKRDIYKHQQLH